MGKKENAGKVLGGPLLARGSEVSRAIYQGTAGHFWPAGQGLRTTVLFYTCRPRYRGFVADNFLLTVLFSTASAFSGFAVRLSDTLNK